MVTAVLGRITSFNCVAQSKRQSLMYVISSPIVAFFSVGCSRKGER